MSVQDIQDNEFYNTSKVKAELEALKGLKQDKNKLGDHDINKATQGKRGSLEFEAGVDVSVRAKLNPQDSELDRLVQEKRQLMGKEAKLGRDAESFLTQMITGEMDLSLIEQGQLGADVLAGLSEAVSDTDWFGSDYSKATTDFLEFADNAEVSDIQGALKNDPDVAKELINDLTGRVAVALEEEGQPKGDSMSQDADTQSSELQSRQKQGEVEQNRYKREEALAQKSKVSAKLSTIKKGLSRAK